MNKVATFASTVRPSFFPFLPLTALPCPLPEDLGRIEPQDVLQAAQVALVALIPPHRLTVRQLSCRLGAYPACPCSQPTDTTHPHIVPPRLKRTRARA